MKYRAPKSLMIEKMDNEEYIVFNTELGTFACVNETARRILGKITTGSKTVAEIVDDMEREYDIEKAELEKDVESVVEQMYEKGFIAKDRE